MAFVKRIHTSVYVVHYSKPQDGKALLEVVYLNKAKGRVFHLVVSRQGFLYLEQFDTIIKYCMNFLLWIQ